MPILHLFVYTVVIKIGAKNVQNVVHTIKKNLMVKDMEKIQTDSF